jgi:serine/threonine protein kinase
VRGVTLSAMLCRVVVDVGLPRALGRYRLLSRIGEGGMGEVYRAELTLDGGGVRSCAIKLILPHRRLDAVALARFRREAALASRVHHENVVEVLDSGTDPSSGSPYLVMELIDGVTLRALAEHAWATGSALPVEHVCTLVADVARGLAAIHGMTGDDGAPLHVVHRDVTPENVLVTRDGVARIGDFGVARARDDEALTQDGGVGGKTPYLSPEQLDGEGSTSASDIFSLGVSLSFLLTGRRPFDRATELATMNAIVDEEFPTMSHDRPELPRELSALVRAMVEKNPALRPGAAAVADGLAAIVTRARPRDPRPTALVEAILGPPDPLAAEPLQTRVLSLSPAAALRLRHAAGREQSATLVAPAPAGPSAPTTSTRPTARRRLLAVAAVVVVVVVVVVVAVVVAAVHFAGGASRPSSAQGANVSSLKDTDHS